MARSIPSFAFFVLAILTLANGQIITHGYISAINRQTSGNVLSFIADLSALTSLTGIEAYYSIGIAVNSTEILNWKQITGLQAVNTITETFATAIPDDYPVYLNLKVLDTTGPTATYFYSSALKVGDRLLTDTDCTNIFNPVGTSTQTPPQPAITIEYDNVDQLFSFTIVTKYLLQGYTWVIDFAPFTGDHNKGTKGLAATNCENRQTADLTGRNFAEFWNAAPAADLTGALNSPNYLSYRVGAATKWNVEAVGCDKVKYSTPGFSFNDLLSCTKSDQTTPSIVRTIVNNVIQYNGTLYVTAVKPVDPMDESAGFESAQFTVPFFVSFSVSSTAIDSGVDSNIFGFSISSLNIQADGNLAMVLATNTFAPTYYLTSPSVTTKPGTVNLANTAPLPSDTQQQLWTFKTSTAVLDYSGSYAIQFTRTDGTSSVPVTASFSLSLTVNNAYNNVGLKLPTTLSFYGDNSFSGTEDSAYTSLDTIYVKSTVTINNGQDENSYANSIYNVWLCYTVDNSVPVWDPTNNQLGCTTQTWNIRPISRLVIDGGESSGILEDQFATLISNSLAPQTSINSGVSFSAAPLAAMKSGTFYIQVESRINLPAKKRSTTADASSTEIRNFSIAEAGTVTPSIPKTPFASSANVAQVSAATVAVFGGLLLL